MRPLLSILALVTIVKVMLDMAPAFGTPCSAWRQTVGPRDSSHLEIQKPVSTDP